MIFQHNRNHIYKLDILIFKLTRAQKISYSLSINLLFKDFNYIIRKISYNSKIKNLSNKKFNLIETSKDI